MSADGPTKRPAIVRLQAPNAIEAQRAPQFRRFVVDHIARGAIQTVAYALDSSMVVAGFASGEVVQWSPDTEKSKVYKRHVGAVLSLDPSPDVATSRIVSAGADGMLYRWSMQNEGKVESIPGHLRTVWMVKHSPDGAYFASCSADRTVRLWDGLTTEIIAVFDQHHAGVTCVQFNASGLLVSGGWDNDVIIFDVESREPVFKLKGHSARVTRIAFNPVGDLLATSSSDYTIRVWNPKTGECYDTIEVHGEGVTHVELSAATLVSGADDGTLWRMDLKNERPRVHPIKVHTAKISGVAFSPDASVVATVSLDGSAALWDANTINNICRFVEPGLNPGHNPITCCVFSPDGTKLVTGGKAGKMIIWDLMPQVAIKPKKRSCVIS